MFPDAACVVGVFCCHAGKGAAALGAVDVSAFARVQLLLQMRVDVSRRLPPPDVDPPPPPAG